MNNTKNIMTDEQFWADIAERYPGNTLRRIITDLEQSIETARAAAHAFYIASVTLSVALAKKLTNNPSEYVIYDEINAEAKRISAFRKRNMLDKEQTALLDAVESFISADTLLTLRAMAKAENGKKRAKKSAKKAR